MRGAAFGRAAVIRRVLVVRSQSSSLSTPVSYVKSGSPDVPLRTGGSPGRLSPRSLSAIDASQRTDPETGTGRSWPSEPSDPSGESEPVTTRTSLTVTRRFCAWPNGGSSSTSMPVTARPPAADTANDTGTGRPSTGTGPARNR
ncbi:hypothetical protein SSIG_07266 [Streptomyces filamentosus NRRL 11379]|nr:hypothetical protein SSIG_07266 [Streptomyces filamentosus NRRL 11379]